MNLTCPLCSAPTVFPHEASPSYYVCEVCDLTFKDPAQRLAPSAEKERYELHDNSDTPAYRQHLAKLLVPLAEQLKAGARGLDFGCGPNPLLAQMMKDQGFPTVSYDPFFLDDKTRLAKKYDFILCCEVVEHFYFPAKEFPALLNLLEPQGLLGIMTQSPPAIAKDFANWYYQRDPTHVVFYSAKTFAWMEKKWSLKRTGHGQGVSLLKKLN